MTKTTKTTTTARRGLLTAGAALAVTAAPAAALASGDAAVIAAAEAVREADIALAEIVADDVEGEAALAVAIDRLDAASFALADIQPRTLAGIRAKALAAIRVFERELGDTVATRAIPHEILGWRLAHDILAMTGGAPWPEPAGDVQRRERAAASAQVKVCRTEGPVPAPPPHTRAALEAKAQSFRKCEQAARELAEEAEAKAAGFV